MTVSISNYAVTASSTTSPKTQSTTWVTGDVVVLIAIAENNTANTNTPTATGLTFNQRFALGPPGNGSDTGPMLEAWVSDPASGSDTQNISMSETVTGKNWSFARWVISGGGALGVENGNLTEAAISLTVAAGSIVLYGWSDWNAVNATDTLTTGSGTSTKRTDDLVTGHSRLFGDWVGTSAGTFSFGATSYAGVNVAHVAIEIIDALTVPGIPVWNLGTGGDTRIYLDWEAPSNGGAAITDYILETSPNGTTGWTTVSDGTSTATEYLMTGQTNGTAQYFRVSAVNSVGTGTVSSVLGPITPRAASDTILQEDGDFDPQEDGDYSPLEED